MIRTALFAAALTASLFFRTHPGSHDVVWWESHIPALAFVALSLLYLSLPQRYIRQKEFASNMLVLSLAGFIAVFLADKANTSIYAMGITLAVPSMLYLADTDRKGIKAILYISFIICFVAVAKSSSRTGIIVMSLSAIYLLWQLFRFKKKYALAASLGAVLLLATLLFFVKRDSSNGRAFILENTLAMIAERPAGWGDRGFEANYMHRQAGYFMNNSNETAAMLADDIKHPLNEYLYIAINYGVHTLLSVVAAVVALITMLYRRHTKESLCTLHFMALLVIWSCFSYPFTVSFVPVMLLAFLPALPGVEQFRYKNYLRYPAFLLLLLYAGVELRAFNDEREWNNAIEEYRNGNKDVAMQVFDRWEDLHIAKGAMLFSLATGEYKNKDYHKCIEACIKCSNHLASYDLEFLLANSYLFTGNYTNAFEHFETAHNMCPNRFVPLYKQFKIYKAQGDTARMISIGNEILAKRVKVPSRKIDIILNNVRYELQKISNNDESSCQ